MSGKNKLYLCALSFFFLGCAKPNYAEKKSDQNPGVQSLEECRLKFESQSLCLGWTWETIGNTTQYGSFILQMAQPTGGALILKDALADLKVVLWMPSMGHGSVPVQIEKLSVGLYRIKNIFFIMPGEWDVHFQLFENGIKVDEATQRLIL
ncbi:MAG: hypothetical protein ACK5P7_10130 [Bdellovibrio sp.]|jgi:hypothetical protein